MSRKRFCYVGLGALILAGSASALPAVAAGLDVPEAAKTHQFPWGTFHLAPRIVEAMKAGKSATIAVDVMATAIPRMGTEMRAGMQRGCDNPDNGLATNCSLSGPVNTDANRQLSELETLLHSSSIDCLVLQTPLPGQFVRVIDQFVGEGIPVFTFNIDVEKSRRFAFTALNEKQAGEANGEATANLVKEKNLKIDTIALGSSAPDEAWARSRMVGFVAGYKKVFPDAKFFNDADHAVPTGSGYSVKEALTSVTPFLTANPNVNLFFHTDQGIEGVGNVIQNLKLQGKVFASGFNVSSGILDAIKRGVTLVTIDQNYAAQTNAGTQQCVKYLTKGEVPVETINYIDPVVITAAGGKGGLDADTALKQMQAAPK
jgi:ABC-type sugar transport system substrate-binding protein